MGETYIVDNLSNEMTMSTSLFLSLILYTHTQILLVLLTEVLVSSTSNNQIDRKKSLTSCQTYQKIHLLFGM